jgi:hypothetical protein
VIGSQQQSESIDSLNLRPFLRTISYREFLTSLSLILLLTAIFAVMQFFAFWLNMEYLIIVFLSMPLNHIVYRIEHKRSNNFIGRILHDLIFTAIYLILLLISVKIKGQPFLFDLENIVFNFFLFIVLVGSYEIIVEFVRPVLARRGWQIF